MAAVWFIGFSLIWTGLLAGSATLLTQDPVPAKFSHTVWRCAAALSLLPWLIAGAYAVLPAKMATPIPDLPYIGGAAEMISTTPVVQAAEEASFTPAIGTFLIAALLLGWTARLIINMLCQVRLQNIKKTAEPNASLSAEVWAKRLGLKKTPKTASISHGSPFLAGVRDRIIYLPEAITEQRDADIILAHECTHIARGDLLTRPFERLVADIFWFSPFAWIMRRQLDYWREAACDEQTAALTGDNFAYARALANTARVTRPHPKLALPVAAFILPRQATLKKRLTQLLNRKGREPRRGLAIVALATGLILAPLSLAQATSIAKQSIFTHAIFLESTAKVNSPFGNNFDKYKDTSWWHNGVDIVAKKGTPVYAPANAKVLLAQKKDRHGYTVDLLLEDGRKMRFTQLSKYVVKKGDKVWAGQIIGKVGASGQPEYGPHLHLELWKDGELMDPQKAKGLILVENCCLD